ncbi:MAG: GGDEF domain-containing protein [Pseudomonadota bacterium]|nr:GGDEF domain-containing protein [Pseudomonadota bacterium]
MAMPTVALRHLLLVLWLALAGAGPVGAAEAIAAGAPGSATARILALEKLGRARPGDASKQLEALCDSLPVHGSERVELLTVQGLMLATASQYAAAERPAALLEAWGQDVRAPYAGLAQAGALLIRARAMTRGGNLQQADAMMTEAVARLPSDLSARDRYRFLQAQAYIKNQSGKLEDAVRIYHVALTLADHQDDLWRQSEARNWLAHAYYDAHQLDRSEVFANEALALAKRAQDPVAMGKAYNIIGIVLDGHGDQAGERRSFEQAIESARTAGAKIDEVAYLANMSDFYLKVAEYKIALERAERALVLARELHDADSEMVALANIGLAQISLQHIQQGKRAVHEAIEIVERRGSVTIVSDIYLELGLYLEKAGDLAGAIEAYHQHRKLATTLLRQDQQKAILAMQEQYDADRRARSLVLLNREHDLKAEQLRRRDLQQRLWGLLAAASMLSFAVVALLYRRVRRTNQLLSHSNELLQVQSERDPLTGLANRRHFQTAMRQLAADGKLSGTIFLIDIDHFKRINDQHGHSAGDEVLVEVAKRLRSTLREEDLIVRWGGEEFLVVVQSLEPTQIDALAHRLLGVLDRAPVTAGSQRIPVTGSIGFATFPIGPSRLRVPWERAINLVDTAMYLAKAHGRNRAYGVRLLQPADESSLEHITHSLESAWREGQVELTLLQGRAALAVAA